MTSGVVLDASVVLNILGSDRAETILGALPGRRIVVEVTSREITRDPVKPENTGDPLASLIDAGLLERIPLPPIAVARFVELTGAPPPDDLDDGEAAALAVGEALGISVALDEAKGRRIASARLKTVTLLSSAEIFALPTVKAALGAELVDAVFSALVKTRMRVIPSHDGWIRELLGNERAAQCPSLRRPLSDNVMTVSES